MRVGVAAANGLIAGVAAGGGTGIALSYVAHANSLITVTTGTIIGLVFGSFVFGLAWRLWRQQ